MPSRAIPSSELPGSLEQLFWDHDFARLRWPDDRDFVIGRVLISGTWKAIRWLRRTAGDPRIRDWILRRSGRGLSPPQLRFWELILGLPKADVDAWLAVRTSDPWERRWAS